MEEHSAEFDIAISYPTRANGISFIQFILILKSTSGDVNVTAWSKGSEKSVKKCEKAAKRMEDWLLCELRGRAEGERNYFSYLAQVD